MEFIDKLKFAAVCGLDCETECKIYHAYNCDDQFLRKQISRILLNDINRWCEIRCDGCKGAQSICWKEQCIVKECAYSKGYEFCIECEDYPCKLLLKTQKENKILKMNELLVSLFI